MRLHFFILLLLTSLCFGRSYDFNAKTEENRQKILKSYINDKELFLDLVEKNGNLFQFTRETLKNDDEVVLEALGKNRGSFKYEKIFVGEVVSKATAEYRHALTDVNPRFKMDKAFIFKILKNDIFVLADIDKVFLKEKDIVLYYLDKLEKYDAIIRKDIIDKHHSIFKKISPLLLDDEEIISKAVSVFGISLQYASIRLNKNIAKKAVSNNGLALQFVDKELRENKDIIIAALKNNPKAHQYIPYKMRKNKDVLKMLMSQNTDGYMQNKIKRKVKPLAWESYDINETLKLLYGKDRVYETSEDIDIKLPTNTVEHMNTSGYGKFSLSTNKKVKSIAILQKKEEDRALTALYYPYGNTVKIQLPLKILNASLNMMIEGMKVVVVIETEDNHLFINEYAIKYDYFCNNGYGINEYIEDLREGLNTNILKTKYKINEDGTGYFKFMIIHPMLSYREAEKLNVKVNFVSHTSGRIKDKKLFDLYTSEYVSKNPLIKMEFENMKQGENVNFSYSTINGEVISKEVKARKSKKKE